MRKKLNKLVLSLVADNNLRPSDVALYLYLYSHGGQATKSYQEIARDMGYTTRTAKSGIKRLLDTNWIRKLQTQENHLYTKNTYILVDK